MPGIWAQIVTHRIFIFSRRRIEVWGKNSVQQNIAAALTSSNAPLMAGWSGGFAGFIDLTGFLGRFAVVTDLTFGIVTNK